MAALRFFFYVLMKPFTLGFALLGLGGIIAPYTDPNEWWLPAFSGLFLPGILIVNFIVLFFWIYQRKWWIVCPLIALSANYDFFASMYRFPGAKMPENTAGQPVTVATYNIEGAYWITKFPEKYSVKKMIQDYNIDILCFQEFCEDAATTLDSALQRFNMPYRVSFFNRQSQWANCGTVIYSKYPIVNYGEISFNSEINGALWADIKINRDTIRVFNNHLQTTNFSQNQLEYKRQKSVRDWKGQAYTLVKILDCLKNNFQERANQSILVRKMIDTSRYPVIVCGDFNDTPVSFAFNHIISNDLKDGFRDCGRGYGHSFNGLKRLLRIDFMAYGEYFTGMEYLSPEQAWSDHNPVIMKLILKNEPESGIPSSLSCGYGYKPGKI